MLFLLYKSKTTHLVQISHHFGVRQVAQHSFVDVEDFVGHFQVILVGWRTEQLHLAVQRLDHNHHIAAELDDLCDIKAFMVEIIFIN